MIVLGGVLVAAGWVASPVVSMAVHGTIDQRTRSACRTSAPRALAPAARIR